MARFKCLIIINVVRLKLVDTKMVNTVQVNDDHGRDFHPLADHLIKLRNFIKCDFSTFRFSRIDASLKVPPSN